MVILFRDKLIEQLTAQIKRLEEMLFNEKRKVKLLKSFSTRGCRRQGAIERHYLYSLRKT